MTMMIERVNANSPAQAVKSRARGPTITQLRAKQAALVAAAELAASSNAEASVVRHSPVDEAKRWARINKVQWKIQNPNRKHRNPNTHSHVA